MLEPDAELTELVRAELPLPRHHRIRIRPIEGRPGVAELADASADLIMLDAYADGRVPASLTTVEFFADVARVLKPDGVLLANLVDEPGFGYLGRVVAGLRAVVRRLVLVGSSDVLQGAAVRQRGGGCVRPPLAAVEVAPRDRPAAVPGRGA